MIKGQEQLDRPSCRATMALILPILSMATFFQKWLEFVAGVSKTNDYFGGTVWKGQGWGSLSLLLFVSKGLKDHYVSLEKARLWYKCLLYGNWANVERDIFSSLRHFLSLKRSRPGLPWECQGGLPLLRGAVCVLNSVRLIKRYILISFFLLFRLFLQVNSSFKNHRSGDADFVYQRGRSLGWGGAVVTPHSCIEKGAIDKRLQMNEFFRWFFTIAIRFAACRPSSISRGLNCNR